VSAPTDIRLPQRVVERCMGTVFSVDVRAPGVDRRALTEVLRWLHWVDETFSTYLPGSQVSRLARGELSPGECAPEVREVLDRCAELERITDGYFSAFADGRLDPSGLVKGWAIERASGMLAERGSLNHCVNGGGDVQCAGESQPGRPWRIGLADPLRPGMLVGVAVGTDMAVATSGTAERGAHIVDPHSGARPAELASVCLVGRNLATVDAFATAAFAMGAAAPDWIAGRSAMSGGVVFADGSIWMSAELTPA